MLGPVRSSCFLDPPSFSSSLYVFPSVYDFYLANVFNFTYPTSYLPLSFSSSFNHSFRRFFNSHSSFSPSNPSLVRPHLETKKDGAIPSFSASPVSDPVAYTVGLYIHNYVYIYYIYIYILVNMLGRRGALSFLH